MINEGPRLDARLEATAVRLMSRPSLGTCAENRWEGGFLEPVGRLTSGILTICEGMAGSKTMAGRRHRLTKLLRYSTSRVALVAEPLARERAPNHIA